MGASVTIAAIGARTPLGFSVQSAAAVRAGISALGLHPFMVDQVGEPMSAALDKWLTPTTNHRQRMLLLAEAALRELCGQVKMPQPLPSRIPLYVGLPQVRPGFTMQDVESIATKLSNLDELPIRISETNALTDGHAAGLAALSMAFGQIQRGEHEACLVGGVDSYFQPDTMEWLDENRQLAGSVSRSGFVPGEAAGFCLLLSDQLTKRLGLSARAHLSAVALATETKLIKSSDICLGDGLTTAVREALHDFSPPNETINEIYCDMNGERYRGEEWGFVCLRLGMHFDDPTAYFSPADCWGDVGAASGPLFAMLACQAHARAYATGTRTMLWASSEGGLRGVAVLEFSSAYTGGIGND